MALSILDGNQSATTLSTILSSGQHITAHTVVSLGTQAITDMRGAVSGSVVSISNFPSTQTIAGTVTANGLAVGSTVANVFPIGVDTLYSGVRTVTDLIGYRLPISLGDSNAVVSASLSDPIPSGANRIGVVTIGGGTVTIGAGTAQIGSVTASISNSLTISSLPAISGTVTANLGTSVVQIVNAIQDGDGTTFGIDRDFPVSGSVQIQAGSNQIGSVTASISNSVVTFYPLQGTTVSSTNFTSITPSTSLVSAVAGREVLTVFNEGAGNLHISAGATCTTISYEVRLSAGDYWECPPGQLSLAHTAVFATAGTARVTQIS